jgi:CubicO group peptidase (beta-lactamase class C family)
MWSRQLTATSKADNREMTRRQALVAAAGVVACGPNGFSGQAADTQRVDPFHDPIYDAMPQRAELVKHLTAEAVEGQQKVRRLNGLTVTGLPQALPDLDEPVTRLLRESGIPGAAVAVAKKGRLICTRGYGRASMVGNVPVEPTMPACIMSVSKPLTVTAALTLIRDGKLKLDDLALSILNEPPLLAAGQSFDRRQLDITIRQLMSHTAGLFNFVEILNDPARFSTLSKQGKIRLIHGRIGQNDLVRMGMGQKLLFTPGHKFAYSGQGMQMLARVVEKVSGWRLDRYIRRFVMAPLGVRSYYVGSYLPAQLYGALKLPHREQLYDMCPTPYNKEQKRHHALNETNPPYFSWGEADACGWGTMNVIDLLRWVTYYFKLIGSEMSEAAVDRPWVKNEKGGRVQGGMGLGWAVHGDKGKATINHAGGKAGQGSIAEHRTSNGVSFAVLANSDDTPHVEKLYDIVRQFARHQKTPADGAPKWQDYGFAELAFSD